MADLFCAVMAGIVAVLALVAYTIFETMPLDPIPVRGLIKKAIPLFLIVFTTVYIII